MIKILINTSEATEEEIQGLESLFQFNRNVLSLQKYNIDVGFITKDDIEIAKANNTTIESKFNKSAILGVQDRIKC